jgi:Holliday junction resolvase RusA-like endonuclease
MKSILITIPGSAMGKQRPRSRFVRSKKSVTPIIYTPEATRIYESKIAAAYIQAKGEFAMPGTPVSIKILVFEKKSKNQKEKIKADFPIKTPDMDNIAKIVMDGLNGIAYQDDRQVVDICALRFWSDSEPHVLIRVEEKKIEKTKEQLNKELEFLLKKSKEEKLNEEKEEGIKSNENNEVNGVDEVNEIKSKEKSDLEKSKEEDFKELFKNKFK